MSNDAEDVVQQALDLLTKNKVGSNIEYLLNTYDLSCDGTTVSKAKDISENDKSALAVKKIETQLNISYNDKLIQIIVCNRSSDSLPDGDSYDFSTLLVIYKNVCVLHDKIDNISTRYGSEWQKKYFFAFNLKSFTNGNWMADLSDLVNKFELAKQHREESKKQESLSKVASNINLKSID